MHQGHGIPSPLSCSHTFWALYTPQFSACTRPTCPARSASRRDVASNQIGQYSGEGFPVIIGYLDYTQWAGLLGVEHLLEFPGGMLVEDGYKPVLVGAEDGRGGSTACAAARAEVRVDHDVGAGVGGHRTTDTEFHPRETTFDVRRSCGWAPA